MPVAKENTWKESADLLPRLCGRVGRLIGMLFAVFCMLVFLYQVFLEGRSLKFPTIPLGATSSSNAVKTEY
jgi:hypothetical protein